jgi:hypothetical protein
MEKVTLRAEDAAVYLGTQKISVCPADPEASEEQIEELIGRGWEAEGVTRKCLQSTGHHENYYLQFKGKTEGIEYNGGTAGYALYFPDEMECDFTPLEGGGEYYDIRCQG